MEEEYVATFILTHHTGVRYELSLTEKEMLRYCHAHVNQERRGGSLAEHMGADLEDLFCSHPSERVKEIKEYKQSQKMKTLKVVDTDLTLQDEEIRFEDSKDIKEFMDSMQANENFLIECEGECRLVVPSSEFLTKINEGEIILVANTNSEDIN